MSILVFGWVFCILSHSDPVLFTNAFVIVVVGVLGSYLIHEIGHWLALSVTSPDAEARWESTLLRISLMPPWHRPSAPSNRGYQHPAFISGCSQHNTPSSPQCL